MIGANIEGSKSKGFKYLTCKLSFLTQIFNILFGEEKLLFICLILGWKLFGIEKNKRRYSNK